MSLVEQIKVLVADDMTTSRMLIIDSLHEIGFRHTSFVRNGADALQFVMKTPVHLIVSDFEMPVLDGIGLLKSIREYAPTRHIPFIMVTGRGDKQIIERARQYGLNNYVAKPFTTEKLRAALQVVIRGI